MKGTSRVLVAMAFMAGARAAPIEHVSCPEGVYHEKPFALTIDYGAGTLEGTDNVLPDTLKITDKTVEWAFMRGWAVYHRDTHVLEWDATGEQEYLESIGHPGPEPSEWYQGKAQCEVKA